MGAFDATTSVTDGVTDNLAQYHNELKTAADHAMSAAAYAAYGTPASMTGNVTLTDASLPILSYAPTAARDLTLPAVATTNHAFYVINRSGTYAITVKDAAAATITTVAVNSTAFLVSDGANSWYPMGGGLTKAAGSDVATGTDDAKYVTSKAIKDSVNVPNVTPVTDGHVMTVASGAWTSAAVAVAVAYPKQDHIFMYQVNSNTAISHDINANQILQLYSYQVTPANADWFEVGLVLSADTYTVSVLGITQSTCGKLDWTWGGTSQTTAQDWYSAAGAVNNVVKTFTLTVATYGYAILKATVNGKNASSSNYYYQLTSITIKPATY